MSFKEKIKRSSIYVYCFPIKYFPMSHLDPTRRGEYNIPSSFNVGMQSELCSQFLYAGIPKICMNAKTFYKFFQGRKLITTTTTKYWIFQCISCL